MRTYEATDGPYLRWCKWAKAKVGERVWDSIAELDPASADAILSSLGIPPFSRSPKEILRPLDPPVFVPVQHQTNDWIRPIEEEPREPSPRIAPDPGLG